MGKLFFTLIFLLILPFMAMAATDILNVGGGENSLNGLEIQQDDSIQFTYPISTTVIKRKKPIIIRWKNMQAGTVYFLELFKGGIYQKQIAEIENVNEYEWTVDKDVKGGKDYQFRLVNSRFFGDFTMSEQFIIKNRIPRTFWVIPAAAGAAGLYFLIKLFLEREPDVPDLPAPIEPD